MKRLFAGAAAGGAVFLGSMVVLAALSGGLGLLAQAGGGSPDLTPWLVLELVAGIPVAGVAGFLARRVGQTSRAPRTLAAAVLLLGFAETAALLRAAASGAVLVPTLPALVAPFAVAAGVLLGGAVADPHPPRRLRRAVRWTVRRPPWSELARWGLPVAVLAGAAAIGHSVLPAMPAGRDADVLAAAVTLDLTVVAPGLVFVFLVRSKRLPWLAVLGTFALGWALAVATLPPSAGGLFDRMGWLVVVAEAAVLATVVLGVRRAIAATTAAGDRDDPDLVTRVRGAAGEALGNRVAADIVTTEIAILYHAFRPPRRRAADPRGFTAYREAGYPAVFGALLLGLLVETLALHLLVALWSPTAAWVLTGLGAYAALWLWGDFRALRDRPIRVAPTGLRFRLGLRWEVDVAHASVTAVDRLPATTSVRTGEDRDEALVAVLFGAPNVRIELAEAVEVVGLYGMRRRVRAIEARVDDVPAFVEALRSCAR